MWIFKNLYLALPNPCVQELHKQVSVHHHPKTNFNQYQKIT